MGQLNRFIGAEPIPAAVHPEQSAHGLAKLVCIPLRIVRGAGIYVADRHALYIGLLQEAKHDTQALRTDTDESDVDLVAGRDISRAAQNPARNDRKPRRSHAGLPQELAPRHLAIRAVVRATPTLHLYLRLRRQRLQMFAAVRPAVIYHSKNPLATVIPR